MDNAQWLNYVQQYFAISFGCFSVFTSICGVLLISSTARLRNSYPFYLALCITDGIIALAYVIGGVYRLNLTNDNRLLTAVRPTECLKQPFVYLYFGGSEFTAIISVFVALERMISVSYPNWFKKNWTLKLSQLLLTGAFFYSTISLILMSLAVLDQARQKKSTQAACYYASMAGNFYAIYHFLFLVVLSSLAVCLGIVSFLKAKSKLQQLQASSKSFVVMMKELRAELTHIIMVLVLSFITYILSISTNIIYLNSAAGWSKFDWNTIGGKAVTSCYCLSCGLTISVLVTMKKDVRNQFFHLVHLLNNNSTPQGSTVRPVELTAMF